MSQRMSWDDVCHFIAQGAVNITEGKDHTVDAGSLTHRAMEEFCLLVSEERLGPPTPEKAQELDAKKELRRICTFADECILSLRREYVGQQAACGTAALLEAKVAALKSFHDIAAPQVTE